MFSRDFLGEPEYRGLSQRMSKNEGKPRQGRILFTTFSCRLIKSRSYEETHRLDGTVDEFVGNKVVWVETVGLAGMAVPLCGSLGAGSDEGLVSGAYAGTS